MISRRILPALVCALLGALSMSPAAGAMAVSYLYNLSDFSGPVPYDDVKLHADFRNDEIYAAVGNFVRVFGASGMEIHKFEVDPRPGTVFDLLVDASGDILLLTLSFDSPGAQPGWFITRCDYRGQPKDRITVADLPPEFAAFRPNVMLERDGGLLLVSLAQFQAIQISFSGAFQKGFDLAKLIDLTPASRSKNDIAAFGMDPRGNMLITIPTLFRVFVVSPDGKSRAFGHAGSSAGSFGNVAGVAGDDEGNVFVADKGRGVVLVFDRQLEFVTEFGLGDDGRPALTRPTDLILGPSGKLYVTQARERGVAVFKVERDGGRQAAHGDEKTSLPPREEQDFGAMMDLVCPPERRERGLGEERVVGTIVAKPVGGIPRDS